ncbi:hypothetical protein [Williamsia sp. M5A3_1d]
MSRSGWTIADRVATGVLMMAQCLFVVWALFPTTPSGYTATFGVYVLAGMGVVAIAGPIVILVTVVLVIVAIDRRRVAYPIPLAGGLLLIVLYIFPIMVLAATRG